ncbi:TetR/AcrR family transcriptional regulator [Clostridium autoethanogenum]|uniref:TetR/AcrR family transcriptional regulator n=2 Tax=Clostridium autoethanogenum TaxID=84023 RepID=A0A3M0T2B8_9CLOT|nr:TetR/AcrR family transcriptional regulator [Clostridium autoethanogenum]AGY76679.1 TetR/AcrR family transcriptional regulator [Clostridium autoethanogenum DSM 10061]ALU36834.1 Transcriptional regulator TetR family [Clostridium autoethanogenum DSM 10061]OVY50476.1 DNA-binding transcriptional repressor AcrR [Clostridium autoethanogenum]RMD04799.1 TetR/AcrR family transcriptional regulator [Clostridium autoethanogenum]
MPNKTFFNLPKERQKEIIEISIKEFSNHDFDSSSLNRIITNLKIAKGSFYRYFSNKTDLYIFLIDYTLSKQLAYITNFKPEEEYLDAITLSKKLVIHVLEFDFMYYNYASFLFHACKSEQFKSYLPTNRKEFIAIIDIFQDKKLIRRDLDKNIIIFYIFRNMVLLRDFIVERLNIPEVEFSKGYATYKKHEKSINEITETYCDLLINGIKQK